jgi:hypothetical protein
MCVPEQAAALCLAFEGRPEDASNLHGLRPQGSLRTRLNFRTVRSAGRGRFEFGKASEQVFSQIRAGTSHYKRKRDTAMR